MKVLRGSHDEWIPPEGGAAVAVGVFDGVHQGHRAVLGRLRSSADGLGGLPVVVLTFDPHPLAVVAPERAPCMLTSMDQRVELLWQAGVDAVAILEFDDRVRGLDPEEFAGDVLVAALGASVVAVGDDFRFGRDRLGTVETLIDLGMGLGYAVERIALVGDDAPVSSSTIRSDLAAGDVESAAVALGRPYEVRGAVVEGDGRGRGIGVPTANLGLGAATCLPGNGVYSAWAGVGSLDAPAVVNVGVRPTFDGDRRVVEAHLLDFDADLYGQELRVAFVHRLRAEQRFDGVDALVAQIHRDIAEGRRLLGPLRAGTAGP